MTHARSSIAPAALALGFLCSSLLVAGQTTYTATLSPPPYKPKDGDNSPPPPHSSAQGSATIVVGNGQVTYSLTLKDVSDFYQATLNLLPASNETVGPVVYILPAGNATAAGKTYTGPVSPSDFVGPLQFKDFAAFNAALSSGLAYVNVRTNSFPVSAIQGRLQGGSASTRRPSLRRFL